MRRTCFFKRERAREDGRDVGRVPDEGDVAASVASLDAWLQQQPLEDLHKHFQEEGYIKLENLLEPALVESYRGFYSRFLDGTIDSSAHRHDLGSHAEQKQKSTENVTQIMWPSDYIEGLQQGPLHQRVGAVAKALLGDDVEFDFDMMIYKAPHTDTEVPWHQDQGYWLDMPDKRALSCWVALDDAFEENGCMWFGPGSHKLPLLPHRPAAEGNHVLMCDYTEAKGVSVPLKPGSATMHHGATLHHTRGNSTETHRRAYILNFRPKAMIEYSRSKGFDHGRKGLENVDYDALGDAYKGRSTAPKKRVA